MKRHGKAILAAGLLTAVAAGLVWGAEGSDSLRGAVQRFLAAHGVTFSGDDLTSTGTVTAVDLVATTSLTVAAVEITGGAEIGDDLALVGSLSVGVNADITGALDVDGATTLDAVTIAETLGVSGIATLASSLAAQDVTATTIDATGAAHFLFDVDALTADTAVVATISGAVQTNVGAAGTVTASLPAAPAVGTHYHFVRVAAFAFRVDPDASDHIVYSGGAMSDGEYLELGSTGARLELTYVGSNTWVATDEHGTLTEETP